MESEEFDRWKTTMLQSFSGLSDRQKCTALELLIDICGPAQLTYLSELQTLMQRDFLKLLPLEISYHVIKWLDIDSLKTCCLVSKKWNDVVNGCAKIWLAACHNLGFNKKYAATDKNAHYWKTMCRSLTEKMKALTNRCSFKWNLLEGHTGIITAIYYANGILVSGSYDLTVRIWNVNNNECKKVIQTHSCADIKFVGNQLVTASYNCTVGLWDMETGSNVRMYVGHTSAVFCVDLDVTAQIIVSGSGDCTIKVWSLNSNQCLKTFVCEDWVKNVIVERCKTNSLYHRQGEVVILGAEWTTNVIKIWSLSSDYAPQPVSLKSHTGRDITMNKPYLKIDGNIVICAWDKCVNFWNFETLQMINSCELPCLLGYGSMFGLGAFYRGFTVLCRFNNHIISKHINELHLGVPKILTIGADKWLDGWDHKPESGLVFAAVVNVNHSILLVKW
ncbi:F-box/WD repeat-containing protein 2-like [Antedon mediterranea]|uniref:F-box/WD repeat-containing protein 2-like n=1 Tax=Antedon mediterranea TaxID=105859 RepID=UPI003AF883C6